VQTKIFPKILLIFLPIILIIFLLGLYYRAQKADPPSNTQQTEITPTPTFQNFVPSKWAGDEEVLTLETELNLLEKKLQEVDLKQLQLLPPVLDMNINFK
jgi:hypothetical protein